MEDTGLKFPLQWNGRLISYASAGDMSAAVRQIINGLGLSNGSVATASSSKGGTYRAWQVSAELPDLQTLRMLFSALENIPGVKMLI